MDTPYYIESVRSIGHEWEYRVYRSGEGHILTAFTMNMARRVVDAFNQQVAHEKGTTPADRPIYKVGDSIGVAGPTVRYPAA